jgi:hypothetical protein
MTATGDATITLLSVLGRGNARLPAMKTSFFSEGRRIPRASASRKAFLRYVRVPIRFSSKRALAFVFAQGVRRPCRPTSPCSPKHFYLAAGSNVIAAQAAVDPANVDALQEVFSIVETIRVDNGETPVSTSEDLVTLSESHQANCE